jgi:hypothetical protein
MPDKVYRIAFAGEEHFAVVRFPGTGLRFAHDGEIGLAAGAKFENDIACGGAVSAFGFISTGCQWRWWQPAFWLAQVRRAFSPALPPERRASLRLGLGALLVWRWGRRALRQQH